MDKYIEEVHNSPPLKMSSCARRDRLASGQLDPVSSGQTVYETMQANANRLASSINNKAPRRQPCPGQCPRFLGQQQPHL